MVFGEQGLAVEFDLAQLGMQENLVILETGDDFVQLPELDELWTDLAQGPDELTGTGGGPGDAKRDTEVRDLRAALMRVRDGRVAGAFGGIGEPSVDARSCQPGVLGVVAEERGGEPVLHERFTQAGQDQRGGVVEPVEDALERGGDMCVKPVAGRRVVSGESVEVVSFVGGEAQRPGEGAEHLLGWLRTTRLLQTCVVVRRHPGQRRDFFASQARGAPPWPGHDTDVFRAERPSSVTEEIGEL